MRRPARPTASRRLSARPPRSWVVRSWCSWDGLLLDPVKPPRAGPCQTGWLDLHRIRPSARPSIRGLILPGPFRSPIGIETCSAGFLGWHMSWLGSVRLLADERSHWTLTPARNQVATGFWVRSGTIPMGARQLVRQDGWQAAIFGGRNRPSLLMVAHQLASASRSSSAALTSLVALDSGTNLDSGAEGPTERTARSRKPIERDRNRSWS